MEVARSIIVAASLGSVVSTKCTFRVRPGLWTSPEKAVENHRGPGLEVTTSRGVVLVEPNNNSSQMLPPRLLCLHRRSKSSTLAVLKVANSASYLFRMWPYFVSSVTWTTKSGIDLALWLGELPDFLAQNVSNQCLVSPEFLLQDHAMREKRSYYDGKATLVSNHHAKILATHALLDRRGGVVYEDLDTYALQPDETERAYRNVHEDREAPVEVLFGRVKHNAFWRVKSSSFYVRDSRTARMLLSTWMTSRCGFKDQFSLWHAILQVADAHSCLSYRGEIMNTTYKHAGDEKGLLHFNMSCAERELRCPAFRFCSTQHTDFGSSSYTTHKSIRSFSLRALDYRPAHLTTAVSRLLFAYSGKKNTTNLEFLRLLGIGESQESMM